MDSKTVSADEITVMDSGQLLYAEVTKEDASRIVAMMTAHFFNAHSLPDCIVFKIPEDFGDTNKYEIFCYGENHRRVDAIQDKEVQDEPDIEEASW